MKTKTVETMTDKMSAAVMNENYKSRVEILNCALVRGGRVMRSDADAWVTFPAPPHVPDGVMQSIAGHWAPRPDLDAADFPQPPTLENTQAAELDAGGMLAALRALVPACSRDSTRWFLNGVNCEFARDSLTMTATDGRRLHTVDCEIDYSGPDCSLIIHPVMLARLIKHGTPGGMLMRFGVPGKPGDAVPVAFAFESGLSVLGNTICGIYPDCRQVIPGGRANAYFSAPVAGFADALKRLAPYLKAEKKASDSAGALIVSFDRAGSVKLGMRSKVETIDGRCVSVPAGVRIYEQTPDVTTLLDASYLSDICTAARMIGGDSLVFGVTDYLSPFVVASGPLRVVLMPMRLDGFDAAKWAKVEKAA
jgi:hypothetical protein